MKKYNRVLLKLSGESLAGDKGMGIDFEKVLEIIEMFWRLEHGKSSMNPLPRAFILISCSTRLP